MGLRIKEIKEERLSDIRHDRWQRVPQEEVLTMMRFLLWQNRSYQVVAEILKKFDLVNVKTAITPMETKVALTKDEEAVDVDVHLYRSMIGHSQDFTSQCCEENLMYLKGKPHLGLWYPRESPFDLEAYSDSDYGGSNLDRKSTTGGCQFLGQRLISWQCKKQTIVATSTTEAEYVAAANCCGQATLLPLYLLSRKASIRHMLQLADAAGITLCQIMRFSRGWAFGWYFSEKNLTPNISPPTSTPTPIPASIPTPTPIPETEPEPLEHTFEEPSPAHQHFSPPQEQAQGQMTVDDLLQVVPQLISRIDSLETDLKQTKLTMGNAIVKLVKKVKKLEGFLKRRNVVLSDSEEEEPEAQGRKSQDDPLVSLVQGLVTPSMTTVNASGEEQVEDISPNTLEAAKTLSRVASLKPKSIDKGRRYKRRKETKGKKVVTSLDFQEEVDTGAKGVNTAEGVNTGSIKVSTVSEQVSTGSTKRSIPSPDKGQREGKAPMIIEETPKKSREQILQEEASLAEVIRLDTLQKEEEAKQIEANAELSKSMLGSDLQGEDFAKKMVDLVNQRKKYFAKERARAKRNKPMTQSQLKTYMMNYLKNQGTWKLSQLKNLSFEEVKEEFDKLVKQVESFAPINFEATKASLKRFGEELQTKTSKRLKSDEAKDDEPTKKSGKRRKQMARKGLHTDLDKDDSEDSDEVSEQDESVSGTKIPINPVPVAMKSPSIATYKIIKQGEKGVYQIVREDGTDIVYINFGAMLKDISRDDLTELYRIVMNRYGMDGPEDELEKVFWKYLKNMFEEPLSTDPIWSALGQQRIMSWRYYDTCRVHCLNLESMDIYMLIERKYPLSAEICKAMLDKKLQGGKPDEDCYKMLKMMEKQAGVNTPGSDENRLKLYVLMYNIVKVADTRVKDYVVQLIVYSCILVAAYVFLLLFIPLASSRIYLETELTESTKPKLRGGLLEQITKRLSAFSSAVRLRRFC
ncbi:uncharacterized mitochondrial protein-like protein [Tanacetum coccineum]